MMWVSIWLSSNPKVLQIIDILVTDILEFYGLILSRDWFEKLHGYFATDWSHIWFTHNGKPNQTWVDREKHMKHSVTNLDKENKLVVFTNNILGNYTLESFFGSFTGHELIFLANYVCSQIENCSQTYSSRCINIVENHVNKCANLF